VFRGAQERSREFGSRGATHQPRREQYVMSISSRCRQRCKIALAILSVIPFAAGAQSQRGIEPSDPLRLQRINPGEFSPDGLSYAFTMQRPYLDASGIPQDKVPGSEQGDIWVSSAGGELTRITNGASEHLGCHSPNWSPNGKFLSFMCESAEVSEVFIWARTSSQVRRIDNRTVSGRPTWLESGKLLYVRGPEGWTRDATTRFLVPPLKRGVRIPSVTEYSSRVLESQPVEQLVLASPEGGEKSAIAEGHGLSVLAYSHKVIIFTQNVRSISPQEEPLAELGSHPFQVSLGVLLPNGRLRYLEDPSMLPSSVQFDSSGKRCVFVGRERGERAFKIFSMDLDSLQTQPVGDSSVDTSGADTEVAFSAVWLGNGKLAFTGRKHGSRPDARTDWWIEKGNGHFANLTEMLPSVPREMVPAFDSGSLIGLSNGRLWKFNSDALVPDQIGAKSDFDVNGWFIKGREFRDDAESILVQSPHDSFIVDLRSGTAIRVDAPDQGASVVGYSSQSRSAVLLDKTRIGHSQSLWVYREETRKATRILENNQFSRDIVKPEKRFFTYEALDGQKLAAFLYLPIGYEPGHRYPMVVCGYGGLEENPDATDSMVAFADFDNAVGSTEAPSAVGSPIYLTSRGYAVLFVSIPLEPTDRSSDPLVKLTNGVIPAVDKAIELGYADENRLGFMGYSYGGYTAYGLLTQTKRFRAAVAGGGISDLVSVYGTFNVRLGRNDPLQFTTSELKSEGGQFRMGVPPWENPERYLMNSPLFMVSKITTPLLIYHGDCDDDVPVQQGEEMFSALQRLGKRATFLRYWGDDHSDWRPADTLDLWRHVFSWFDEFLKSEPSP
jgi:dipeptidyl aminopeptidase/acylaminoacyl peptidase